MAIVKDGRFWIGVAVGALVVPMVLSQVGVKLPGNKGA